jgi:hypothetical protein
MMLSPPLNCRQVRVSSITITPGVHIVKKFLKLLVLTLPSSIAVRDVGRILVVYTPINRCRAYIFPL